MNMKMWKCGNMEISSSSKFEFEKGKIHSPTPTRYFNLLAALGVCTLAYCAAFAAPEWEDPAVNSINRLPARTYSVPLADEAAAFTDALEFPSPYAMSLNGEWKFRWVGDPARRPPGFEATDFDDSGWGRIDVPSCVEMRGYGAPGYTNTRYPHKKNPPKILDWASGRPDNNPVSSYRRTFTLPAAWRGRDTILRFEGVGSAFYVWVNGKFAGYAEDSKLPSEFDVTPLVREDGENLIAVQVFKWCDGSYLEDQDMFRFSGIFRDVSLWSRPKGGMWDFAANVKLKIENGKCSEAELSVDGIDGEWTATLYDAEKKVVAGLSSAVATSAILPDALLWSAEKPYLYTLVVKKGGDIRARRVGFKDVRIDGNRILVNGQPVKFKGVNRHETSPENGRTVTLDDMMRDIALMKRYNVNTVRTCHYPDHRLWYDLCDRYGIYIVAEANVEGHGMGYGEKGLGLHAEWKDSIVERNVRQVLTLRNSPSVTIWSMGNETKHGDNFRAAIAAVKALDPTRPVHWERGNIDADVDSTMYPSVDWLDKRGKLGDGLIPDDRMPRKGMSMKNRQPEETDQTRMKPFFLCEYAHAMGNAMGNFEEYWDVFYKYASLSGGCIWDWADQGVWKDSPHGRYLAYGGDFDEEPNDGPFCMNGVVGSERNLSPKLLEMAHVHRNLVVRRGEDGKFSLENRFCFTYADEFDGRWELLADGEAVAGGDFAVPSVAPLAKAPFAVVELDAAIAAAQTGKELFVNFAFSAKKSEGLIPKGWVVAREQIGLTAGRDARPARPRSCGTHDSTDETPVASWDGGTLTVERGGTKATFDKASGTMTSLRIGGVDVLEPGGGPRLTCARAFGDNDRWMAKPFFESGLSQLRYHTECFAVEGDTVKCVVDVTGSKGCGFRHECGYVFGVDGSVTMKNRVEPYGVMPELPRLGLSMRLPKCLDSVRWYGRGPHENYIDRCTSAFFGVWTSKAADLFVDYARPQDNGYRTGARWVEFADAGGVGVRFVQSEPIAFQALEYGWEQMYFSRHLNGERRRHVSLVPEDATLLNIDIRQTGLGGESCGPIPLDNYRFDPSAAVEWTLRIEPAKED